MYNINILKQESVIANTNEHNINYKSYVVDRCYMASKFGVLVDEEYGRFLHKMLYKSHAIAISSSCTTTEWSIPLTFYPTVIENNTMKYHE